MPPVNDDLHLCVQMLSVLHVPIASSFDSILVLWVDSSCYLNWPQAACAMLGIINGTKFVIQYNIHLVHFLKLFFFLGAGFQLPSLLLKKLRKIKCIYISAVLCYKLFFL